MYLLTKKVDDVLSIAKLLKETGASGLLLYSVKGTRSGGATTNSGTTVGFESQKTFELFLQTTVSSVYFKHSYRDKNEIEQANAVINEIATLYSATEVEQLRIDSSNKLGEISF